MDRRCPPILDLQRELNDAHQTRWSSDILCIHRRCWKRLESGNRKCLHHTGGAGHPSGVLESERSLHLGRGADFRQSPGNRRRSRNPGVIVTTDLVGVQDAVFHEVCERIEERTGLKRNQILLNASHTHTGPLVSLNPVWSDNIAYSGMTPEDASRTVAYTLGLRDKVVRLVEEALANLEPADLSWATGEVGFVMNRRVVTEKGVAMAPNPEGVTDPIVPVLRVRSSTKELKAVLFGCACHNTTLTGAHNLISGDYAGYAQTELEEKYPDALALFLSGCGADANPEPRGTIPQAKDHGRELAKEVSRILESEMTALTGPLDLRYTLSDLPLQNLTDPEIDHYASIPSSQSLMAKQMRRLKDSGGALPSSYSAPVALWRFGDALDLVALPAEPVASYAHAIREALGSFTTWVSGYNNDCFGYLPDSIIVEEGGHEAIGITLWIWGRHLQDRVGFFSQEVESKVMEIVRELAQSP